MDERDARSGHNGDGKPRRDDGWYWVRKKGWGEEYGEWVPAEWRQEFRSWTSTRFSGIPDSEMIVGERLVSHAVVSF